MAAQMRAAIRIVASADRERNNLATLSVFLRKRLRKANCGIGRGDTQIVPVFLDENDRAVRFSALLNDAGFGVRPIRPPSVPAGTSRLRISLHAKLSTDMLARFSDVLISIREEEHALLHVGRS